MRLPPSAGLRGQQGQSGLKRLPHAPAAVAATTLLLLGLGCNLQFAAALTYLEATAADGWKCGVSLNRDDGKMWFSMAAAIYKYCPATTNDFDHSYCMNGVCSRYPSQNVLDWCSSIYPDVKQPLVTYPGWPTPVRYRCKPVGWQGSSVPGEWQFTSSDKDGVVAYYTDPNAYMPCGSVNNITMGCPDDTYCCFGLEGNVTYTDASGKKQPVYYCAATPSGMDQPEGVIGQCIRYNLTDMAVNSASGDFSSIKSSGSKAPADLYPMYFANRALSLGALPAPVTLPAYNKFSYNRNLPVLQGNGVMYSRKQCAPGYGRVLGDPSTNLCSQCPFGFWSAGGNWGEATCEPCPAGLTTQVPGAIGLGFCTNENGDLLDYPVEVEPWRCTKWKEVGPDQRIFYENDPNNSVTKCAKIAARYASLYTWISVTNTACIGHTYDDYIWVRDRGFNPDGDPKICDVKCPGNQTERCGSVDSNNQGAAWQYIIKTGSFGTFNMPKQMPPGFVQPNCPFGGEGLQCSPQQFIAVPQPAAPKRNKMGAIASVLQLTATTGQVASGFLNPPKGGGIAPKTGMAFGVLGGLSGIGLGVMGVMKGFKKTNPNEALEKQTAWIATALNQDLSYLADYLTCNMQSNVGYQFYDSKKDESLTEQEIRKFNDGIRSIVRSVAERCQSYNCLNYTNVDPAYRNTVVAGLACCRNIAPGNKICKKGTKWDPTAQVQCSYTGTPGICGSDRGCYSCVNYEQAIQDNDETLDLFASKDSINNFAPVDKPTDINATAAYAWAATVKLLLLQQSAMLGDGIKATQILPLARQTVKKLKEKYLYNIDKDRINNQFKRFSFGSTPAFPCLGQDVLNEDVGSRCSCGTSTCGYAIVTNVSTSSACNSKGLADPNNIESQYCEQTKGSGQIFISSGCLRTQNYASVGLVDGKASCSTVFYGRCQKGGISECNMPVYWGGLGSTQPSSCAYLSSTCARAIVNAHIDKDTYQKSLVDTDYIKSCGAGTDCRDGSAPPAPLQWTTGQSLPYVFSKWEPYNSKLYESTTQFFNQWMLNRKPSSYYWQPNTSICMVPQTAAKVDELDNPFHPDQYIDNSNLAARVAAFNADQLAPVLAIIRLFDAVAKGGNMFASADGYYSAFQKYGFLKYDCKAVQDATPTAPPPTGPGSTVAAASAPGYAQPTVAMSYPVLNCTVSQDGHWLADGPGEAPYVHCSAGHYLAPTGCCEPCPPGTSKSAPGNAVNCAQCQPGMVGAEGAEATGSTFCVRA